MALGAPVSRSLVVIFSKAGQLGNRLFNFANFIAFAAAKEITVVNPSFDEYADFFEGTRRDLLCRYPSKLSFWTRLCGPNMRRVFYKGASLVARIVRKLGGLGRLAQVVTVPDNVFYLLDDNPQAVDVFRNSKVVFVSGLQFRDISDIRKQSEKIRAYFTPSRAYLENIDALIRPIKKRCDVLIGIHIRRGDYATHLNGRYCFEVGDYVRVVEDVKTMFSDKKVAFLICSNDKLDGTLFAGSDVTSGTGHFLEDMYALARCDYIVGPPSTYSLWASFYGQSRLCFLQSRDAKLELTDFKDYFSLIADQEVREEDGGEQYVSINGAKYGLVFRTQKRHLAL
jgi:hypothetical protein